MSNANSDSTDWILYLIFDDEDLIYIDRFYYSSSEAELTKCLEKIFFISQAELNKSQQKFFNALSNWYEDKEYIGNCKK